MAAVPRKKQSVLCALANAFGGRLLSFLAFVGAISGLVWLRQDPRWFVNWVAVSGCRLLPPEKVVEASKAGGAWAIGLDLAQVKSEVMALPCVADAQVSWSWPALLVIRIVEERPEAIMRIGDRQFWAFPGCRLTPTSADVPGLPVIEVVGAEPRDVAAQGACRSLLGLSEMVQLFPSERAYRYDENRGYILPGQEECPVYLGDGRRLEAKLALLAALQADLARQGYKPQFISLESVEGAYYQ
jgi:cell division septal protein FtsQ